jgi:hypothetical protein
MNFPLGRTRHDGNREEERSGGAALSKLDLTIDLELGDVSAIRMIRTKPPSPPVTTMLEGQNVDSGV